MALASLTLPVLAGPVLRAVGPGAIALWFASADALRPSDVVVQLWDPAPDGAHLTVRSPEDREIFVGAQRVIPERVHWNLVVYRVEVRFARPLEPGKLYAYRLRIGKATVSVPGGYARLPSRPGPRAAGPTPGTFVVQPRGVSWIVACHGRIGAHHELLDATVAADPAGPTQALVHGAPFRDPGSVIDGALGRLAAELAVPGNLIERYAAREAAAYLLGWSPIVLATYARGIDPETTVQVAALARMMANVPTLLLDEPPPRGESTPARVVRERAATLFGAPPGTPSRDLIIAPTLDANVVPALASSTDRVATIAGIAPPNPRAIASEVARRDDTFVICLAGGRGYLSSPVTDLPSSLPAGRYHELAAPTGPSRPPIAGGRPLELGEATGFASARKVAASMVLALHGPRGVIRREVPLARSMLRALPGRAAGLYLDVAPELLATLTVRLVRGTRNLAVTRPGTDGRLGWDLVGIEGGSCELRIDPDADRRVREGTGARVRFEAGPLAAELAAGRLAVIDNEVAPALAYALELPERYVKVPAQPARGAGALGMLGHTATTGNELLTLVDGEQTYAAMEAAMARATRRGHFIYVLGWWFDPFASLFPGGSLQASWDRKAKQGVQLRVMPWHNRTERDVWLHIHPRAKQWLDGLADGACIIDDRTLLLGSHHQKLMVVSGDDGLVAFCGGIDLNRDRIEPPGDLDKGEPLHDVHCRVRGPAAHELLDVFVGRWLDHPDHVQFGPRGKTPRPPLLGAERRIRVDRPGTVSMRVVETYNVLHQRLRSACQVNRSQRAALQAAIAAARRYIYIEEQYFVGMEIATWLRDAVARGVELAVLLPANPISAVPQIDYRRGRCFAKIREASGADARVSFHELVDHGQVPARHTYVHAKTWMFDDEVGIIGTANVNRRGISYDSEVGVVFQSPDKVKDLRVALWKEHLACDPAAVEDVAAGLALLRSEPQAASSRIRRFDEHARSVTLSDAEIEASYGVMVRGPRWDWLWDHAIDPDADHLPSCFPR